MKSDIRKQRGEATRRTILAAAADEFSLKGFEGASMRSIARNCGVEPALVQYHFGEKLALWEAVLDGVIDPQYQRWVRISGLRGRGPAELIVNFIEALIRHSASDPHFVAIMSHARQQPTSYNRIFESHIKEDAAALRELIAAAQREGRFIPGRPELLFYILVGAALRLFMTAADVGELGVDVSDSAVIDEHIRTCVNLFILPAPDRRRVTTAAAVEPDDAPRAVADPSNTFMHLIELEGLIRRSLDERAGAIGAPPEQLVALLRISREPVASAAALARSLGMTSQKGAQMVRRLESQGLIKRKANGGRSIEITLTSEGHETVARTRVALTELDAGLLGRLTALERDILDDVLRRVLRRRDPEVRPQRSA